MILDWLWLQLNIRHSKSRTSLNHSSLIMHISSWLEKPCLITKDLQSGADIANKWSSDSRILLCLQLSIRWQISCYMDQSEHRSCSVVLLNSWLIYFRDGIKTPDETIVPIHLEVFWINYLSTYGLPSIFLNIYSSYLVPTYQILSNF